MGTSSLAPEVKQDRGTIHGWETNRKCQGNRLGWEIEKLLQKKTTASHFYKVTRRTTDGGGTASPGSSKMFPDYSLILNPM